ncbi:MAG: ion channel [Bacteroidota bacterium]|nr:ion channel [Bacteroidota bacterium]MDX5447471.1 ion channel [Bacteroidota bacterium]MDX5505354.1 ion channel [Bacteroidota bacterium]
MEFPSPNPFRKNQKIDFSGLSEKVTGDARRVINPDGSFNVRKVGGKPQSFFQYLIGVSWQRFFFLAVLYFFLVNCLFAGLYLLIGIENLSGVDAHSTWEEFWYAFFFSVHTCTTVGYGSISPVGMAANFLASVESFIGLMGFALITGLLYGRFAKPNARVRFSKNILIKKTDGHPELHFQIANERNNMLIKPQVTVLLKFLENGRRAYYQLDLRVRSIVFFPLNWRVVHVIDENSPLAGLSADEMRKCDVEFLILFDGFDDRFHQNIYVRHSYTHEDLIENAEFTLPYGVDREGHTVLLMDKLDDWAAQVRN